ncbi:MAG: acetylglutamate kinase [Thermoanaerobaculia bacterium]
MIATDAPIVVKLGGSLLDDAPSREAVLSAIARGARGGHAIVLVHGGGRRIDATLAARGIPKRTHEGLRVTDGPTLEVVVAVLQAVNRGLVDDLSDRGVAAAGLSGVDAGTLRAEVHPPISGVALGSVGIVASVDIRVFEAMRSAGLLPVLAPLAAGPDGGPLNVNADAVAAAVATALGARRLIFLTDVEGVSDALGRRIDDLDSAAARRLLDGPAVSGGMRPKLAACLEAAAGGVGEVVIAGPERQQEALAGGRGGTRVVSV